MVGNMESKERIMKLRIIGASFSLALVLCLAMAASAIAGAAFAGDKVPRMDTKELLSKIDSPDILIIDVRRGADWNGSELMIKNAERRAFNDVDSWAGDLPEGKTLVLYCA